MLRNVLLKAVQNLRRSQQREGKEVEQQHQEELKLPKARRESNQLQIDDDDDNGMEDNGRIKSTTTTPQKTSTEPTSNDEDSPEKADKGKNI